LKIEDKLVDELVSHSDLANLSFIAFTATQKEKTLQQFGEKPPDLTYYSFYNPGLPHV
jgi:hypothetical protein